MILSANKDIRLNSLRKFRILLSVLCYRMFHLSSSLLFANWASSSFSILCLYSEYLRILRVASLLLTVLQTEKKVIEYWLLFHTSGLWFLHNSMVMRKYRGNLQATRGWNIPIHPSLTRPTPISVPPLL